MTYRIGWFTTGRGKGSRSLLTATQENIRQGTLKTDIAFVFSNREQGEAVGSDEFIALVGSSGIPLITFSSRKFMPQEKRESREQWRLLYDREVMKRLDGLTQDICILAGYMLVVGPEMCQKYDMINLHPAAPGGPTGTWQEVIWTLIERRAQSTGVMMHLVTPQLDKGPTVTYCTFSIRGTPFDTHWKGIEGRSVEEIQQTEGEDNPLFRLIREYGASREIPLIIATIKAFSEGAITVINKEVLDSSGTRVPGYDLTREIDKAFEQKGSSSGL